MSEKIEKISWIKWDDNSEGLGEFRLIPLNDPIWEEVCDTLKWLWGTYPTYYMEEHQEITKEWWDKIEDKMELTPPRMEKKCLFEK